MSLKILIISPIVSIFILSSLQPSALKSNFKNTLYRPAKGIIKDLQKFNDELIQQGQKDSLNSFSVDSTGSR